MATAVRTSAHFVSNRFFTRAAAFRSDPAFVLSHWSDMTELVRVSINPPRAAKLALWRPSIALS